VNGLVLLLILEGKVVLKKLLEAGVAVLLDFLLDDARQIRKLAGHDSATSIALAAGQALLVDLGAVALEARHWLNGLCIVLVAGNKQVTGDVHVLHLDLHLRSLVLHLCLKTVTALILHRGLDLRRHVAHLDTRVDHLLARHDPLGVAAGLTASHLRHDVRTDGDRFTHSRIRTAGNLLSRLSVQLRVGEAPIGTNALRQFMMAHCVEVRVGRHEDVLAHVVTEDATAPRAHDLRLVEALSKRALLLKVSEQLAAGIGDSGGDSQAQAGKILDLERLGEVTLRRN